MKKGKAKKFIFELKQNYEQRDCVKKYIKCDRIKGATHLMVVVELDEYAPYSFQSKKIPVGYYLKLHPLSIPENVIFSEYAGEYCLPLLGDKYSDCPKNGVTSSKFHVLVSYQRLLVELDEDADYDVETDLIFSQEKFDKSLQIIDSILEESIEILANFLEIYKDDCFYNLEPAL